MADFNLLGGPLRDQPTHPGFRSRSVRVADEIGAERLGATLYELGPGERICPYHFHYANEEWLLVVSGAPTLRSPEGERVLRAGDVVCFPTGPEGAHDVRNDGDGPARVLVLSTRLFPEVPVYPESDKIGTRPVEAGGDDRLNFIRAEAVDYWEGGVVEIFNLYDGELDHERAEPEGWRWRAATLGPKLGAALLGATLYELQPGERSFPYHYEWGCEEWLIVVAGTPTLRTPDGERELAPGDTVCFREGPEGAHLVANATDDVVRVMILSNKAGPAVAVYPDSDKIGIFGAGEDSALFGRGTAVDYWDGEA